MNIEQNLKRSVGRLADRYDAELAALDALDNLPEEVQDIIKHPPGLSIPRFVLVSFHGFADEHHFGDHLDADGDLKNLNLAYKLECAEKYKENPDQYKGLEKHLEEMNFITQYEKEIREIQEAYDNARLEIAQIEDIDMVKAHYGNEPGNKFLKAQMNPEYRHLVKDIADKIRQLYEAILQNKNENEQLSCDSKNNCKKVE